MVKSLVENLKRLMSESNFSGIASKLKVTENQASKITDIKIKNGH